jgi:hypothetical protein
MKPRTAQMALPGQGYHFDVEALVGAVLRERVAGPRRLGHQLPGRGHAGEAGPSWLGEGGPGGVPLEHVPQREQLVGVGVGQFGHPDTAPGEVLDEALLRELTQRLAQRSPAGAESLREGLLDEPLARSERAAQDLVLQSP